MLASDKVMEAGEATDFPRALRCVAWTTGDQEQTVEAFRVDNNLPDHIGDFRLTEHPKGRFIMELRISDAEWQHNRKVLYEKKRCPWWCFFAFNGGGLAIVLLYAFTSISQNSYIGVSTDIQVSVWRAFWYVLAIGVPISALIMTAGFAKFRYPSNEDHMAEYHDPSVRAAG